MIHFVYKTTNKVNGKFYIGRHSTNNLDDGYLGSGKHLLLALKKYGKENFKRDILEFCEDFEHLKQMEEYWIDSTQAIKLGYNLIPNSAPLHSNYKGFKWPEEVKAKMRATWAKKKSEGYDAGSHNRGVIRSEETKKLISLSKLGDLNPVRKYGIWNKGIPFNDEVKSKISNTHKQSKKFAGNLNPKFKEIEQRILDDIIIDLENGYGSVEDLAKYYGLTSQRLYRHLYYRCVIHFDDLPKYLKKAVVEQ